MLNPATTCGAVAALFAEQVATPAFAIELGGGAFGLVDRATFLPRYLERYNREIFQRRPVTTLMNRAPLVVEGSQPIEQVCLIVTSEKPEALTSGFVIVREGRYAGVGMGIDLLRMVTHHAQEASIAKTTFLANMSHEIRTPLHAVIGNLELLGLTRLEGEQIELVSTAKVSADALVELIGNLLDLSKIEANHFEIETVDTDLRRLVAEVEAILTPKARQKGLRLYCLVAEDVPAIVRTDGLRLRQVLVNFLANAVKFTEMGHVALTLVRETGEADETSLRFDVSDTGPGFDPTRAEALFEPFVQADSSTTRRFGGTGLGLAISKRIVEMMRGSIGCKAEPGRGSTFWCEIPVQVVAEQEAATPLTTQAAGWAPPAGAPILVIDDTATNRELARRQLRRFGLVVETAENGEIGLQKAQAGGYALIFVDGSMPVMDGFEFARQFRAFEAETGRSRTPVVAMTAHALSDDAERFATAGMDDHLAKPVTLDRLAACLRLWLGGEGAAPTPQPLPPADAPAVDLRVLAALLGEESPEALQELLAIFMADFPSLLEPIRAALAAEDRAALARAAHAGKSAAGSAAANRLADHLAAIERDAADCALASLKDAFAAAEAEFSRLCREAQAPQETRY